MTSRILPDRQVFAALKIFEKKSGPKKGPNGDLYIGVKVELLGLVVGPIQAGFKNPPERKKPWLFTVYRGLYYPIIWWILFLHSKTHLLRGFGME